MKNEEHTGHGHHHGASGGILTAFLLNLIFVIIEAVGGILTNSVAILSDAVHDLGDCAAIGCAFLLERVSKRRADDNYTYGYQRYSLVSALVTALILVAGSALVIYSSVCRMRSPETVRAKGMLFIAVLGIIANGIAVLKTSHGHNANERVISLHMLEDVLGWAAVLVGSVLIWITDQPIIDPILSLCVAVYILWHAFLNIKSVLRVLLECVPTGFDTASYRSALEGTKGVLDVHHLHVWSLDGEEPMATVHAVVASGLSSEETDEIRRSIVSAGESFGVHHLTVQLETGGSCDDTECHTETEYSEEHHHHHHR